MQIPFNQRRIIISFIIFTCTLDLFDLTYQWNHQNSHHHHPYHQSTILANAFILYSTGSSADARPPTYYSSADSWVSEELWPKEKSIIHIKLVKPLPKEIPIWELRNKDNYLNDISLDFDSPYQTLSANNCTISFKSYYDGYSSESNNQEITSSPSNIQAEITGGSNCSQLPLSLLTPLAANLTHLVVRNTGITSLTKFLFGANKLDKIIRLDVIGNNGLTSIQARAFDGLTRLTYLSLINNQALQEVALESFAGLKSLEELIFLGNGQSWDQSYFTKVVKAASDKILPNLIHLHLCGDQVNEKSVTIKANGGEEEDARVAGKWLDYNQDSGHYDNQRLKSKSSSLLGNEDAGGEDTKETTTTSRGSVRYQRKSGLKINKDDFQGLTQVKYLQLSDCDITYIHPSALIPLMRNIVGFNLGGNLRLQVDNLKAILIPFYVSNMKSIQNQVDAQSNNSTFPLSPSGRSSLPPVKVGLDKLDLSYSINTLTVPKDLLTIISKTTITELYMKNVPWKRIREGDIPPMPNLRVLHLDHSQIEYIDEKAFVGLDDLIKLSLRGNFLKEMPLFLLEPLRKLEYLDLSGYKINPQDKDTNPNFTSLDIPRKAFVHGTHLKEVNLSYKNLTQLPRYLFIGLFKLEKLHLRGCNLQYIEYLTFFPLKSIVYIDLSENTQLISNVRLSEEDTFVGLEAVEMIRLSNCNLTTEDVNDFNIFRRMHEHVHLLDLSHNRIDMINPTTLQNFSELRHIDLSHNSIKSWHNYTIFSKNSFITSLDISFNQITHITPEMLGDFRHLKNLSFASNPLQCECDWEGPLLLLDQKQKKLNQLHHRKIQDHIQQLVHRQQEIVSTAFASSQAPPKSIIEWLNTTAIHFLRDRHPLRSNGHYFCHSKSLPPIVFKKFFQQHCPNNAALRNARVSVGILMVATCALLLLAVFLLVIAFFYNSTIRNLLNMVDDDFLHNYQYDAFVSYNVNDSDWVFNKLVPSLEEIPADYFEPNQAKGKEPTTASVKSHIKLCVYDRDFIAGRPISECITESIRNSRKVILVISNNFAASPWCRFETDLAHNTLMDQNREGLILIKLEEMSSEVLEKVAPQLHFLLKTRIYLSWSTEPSEQEIFWRKLRRALGFNKPFPYGTVKQYYKNYVGGLTKERRHSVAPAAAKDEVQVSFRRKKDHLSSSRDETEPGENDPADHDSGIAVVDDSGCVSVNGDENGEDYVDDNVIGDNVEEETAYNCEDSEIPSESMKSPKIGEEEKIEKRCAGPEVCS